MLERVLFGRNHDITKRAYAWNLCASLMYSVQSAILLLVITRIGGVIEAGIFTILYTVTQTLASLGSYSMRNFQASDVNGEYEFKTYYSSRLATCICMLIACIGYGIIRGLNSERFFILMLLSLYRVSDGMEDVFHGEAQKKGRLDVASVAMTFRIGFSVVGFCLMYWFSRSLLLASIVLVAVSFAVFVFTNIEIIKHFDSITPKLTRTGVFRLLMVTFPVFFGAILYNYLVNVPKYAIDRFLGDEEQTIFNILFMPIFVVNILSMFIFKPMVKQMGEWWNKGEHKAFAKAVVIQWSLISIITLTVAVGGYFLGCPVLGLIYGVDLSEYSFLFARLLCYGGIAALATFLSVVLTIMRKQGFVILGYVAGYITSLIMTERLVPRREINGAGDLYGCIMGMVLAVFLIVVCLVFAGKKGVRDNDRTVEADLS
ncbi:MAG: lipopolysaccharide biosynthesis protein [Lachnospiraceae bacterium]|nr:lipopolysaccharide biosynthesis protein [Lachnospiraceae bacterium]